MKQQTLNLQDQNFSRKGTIAYHVQKKQMYGGSLNYRKMKRPLSTTKAINVTLKITDIAYKKSGGFRKHLSKTNKRLLEYAERFNIRIYKHSVNSNHIHFVCKLKDIEDLAKFLRAFAGSMSLYFKKLDIFNIWDGRPFTRLVTWGREFKAVCKYIFKNFKEVVGYVSYSHRANRNYAVIERWKQTG